MSNADYLKRYLEAPPDTSDYKASTKKKKKAKKGSKNMKPSMKIIDNDIMPWNDDTTTKEAMDHDRFLADVGMDAPQIVNFNEKGDAGKAEAAKWKQSSLSGAGRKRYDSSDSDDSDSDADVSRNVNPTAALSYSNKSRNDSSSASSDSDADLKRMGDGTKAGLNTYEKGKKRDVSRKEAFKTVEKGQEATVFRDATGSRFNQRAARKAAEEKAQKRKDREDQWQQWGTGKVQADIRKTTKASNEHEMNKPLARYADDKDLESYQKSIKRIDDPMEKYFTQKAEKRRRKAGGMPKYKGAPPEPNRYNLMPGYRWDGVDRTNGFERKYFRRLADKKALKEFEIQYLTEDM